MPVSCRRAGLHRLPALVLLALVALALPCPAAAQGPSTATIAGQVRALNQQRVASNIVSADQMAGFPDPNVAEAAQRVPGVSLQRDDGEGELMLIRGISPALNSMTMNGERIPSTESTSRAVNSISIASDILQTIEVTKSLRPDQDGDAIGGVVNFVTKQAPEVARLTGNVERGYNDLRSKHPAGDHGHGRAHPDRVAGPDAPEGRLHELVRSTLLFLNEWTADYTVAYNESDRDEGPEHRQLRLHGERAGDGGLRHAGAAAHQQPDRDGRAAVGVLEQQLHRQADPRPGGLLRPRAVRVHRHRRRRDQPWQPGTAKIFAKLRDRGCVRFERRRVWLSVRDDGEGFDVARPGRDQAAGGYGLRGMRERVERLGGQFALQSLPGAGTTVEVSVPLRG